MQNYPTHHATLPNETLVRIAYFGLREYEKEVRKSAKQILAERKIKGQELKELKEQIRKIKKEERRIKLKDKNEKYGLLDFLIDIFLSGLGSF